MKLLLVADIPDWNTFDASRRDQYFRTNLGKTLRLAVDRIVNGGSLGETYGIDGGGSLQFKLEATSAHEPAEEETAA